MGDIRTVFICSMTDTAAPTAKPHLWLKRHLLLTLIGTYKLCQSHPGFISSQVSSCPALGASTPVRMFPLSTWMTFTGRSLIWLVSSRGYRGGRGELSFGLASFISLSLNGGLIQLQRQILWQLSCVEKYISLIVTVLLSVQFNNLANTV